MTKPSSTWALAALLTATASAQPEPPNQAPPRLDVSALRQAVRSAGLEFTEPELELMVGGANRALAGYRRLRELPLPNDLLPALTFSPLLPGMRLRPSVLPAQELALPAVERPADLAALAFADLATLASLIRSRQVSCSELCEWFLARLTEADQELHCVITLTAERARAQAKVLDQELAEGKWRGPLHGIPWGAKDLLAVRGHPTTWGAKPFADQDLDLDASVVQRLDAAGAVLLAKLSLGALAMGDVWFGGMTRNPWNPRQGSSGSSAGSAAAVAAGALPFAIGSETLGSIVSPSTRCGCTSLRPTFGRVSRHGAMSLSWSMDKLGPICRSAQDAALVFAAIHGPDGKDPSVLERPFQLCFDAKVDGWKVGYLADQEPRSRTYAGVLEDLRKLGCELVAVELPDFPVEALRLILNAEAAAAFDPITRDGRDAQLTRQDKDAWPNAFRTARLIPAVEYINANRQRTRLMAAVDELMQRVDVIVHPSFHGSLLLTTNLTGHPTVVAPVFEGGDARTDADAARERGGRMSSVSFLGRLFEDDRVLLLAQAWQRATTHHHRHPRND